jgi:predicted Fe-S protein YdhL (DUF1289 family)
MIKSPCIHVCTLDDEKVCLGCYRSVEEVRNWFRYSDEEKLQAIKNAEERRKAKEDPYAHYV